MSKNSEAWRRIAITAPTNHTRSWRQIAVTAIAAGAMTVGAGVATGNGVALADEGAAPNNSVTIPSPTPDSSPSSPIAKTSHATRDAVQKLLDIQRSTNPTVRVATQTSDGGPKVFTANGAPSVSIGEMTTIQVGK
jgi:hypothetical protein